MKTKFVKLSIMILGILCGFAGGCSNPSFPDHRNFLRRLPETQKLNTLALIGTHNSATYNTPILPAKTQVLTIVEQLNAGIRVFDMRVRRIENVFMMHHNLVYLGMPFGDIINEIRGFLESYPEELVIMFMQEEYEVDNSNMNECEMLVNKYIEQYNNRDIFVQNWSVTDTIGEHRGKILLASSHRGFRQCITTLPCREQNEWQISFGFNRKNKWDAIVDLQEAIVDPNRRSLCYINYLSAHGGTIGPQEIANEYWHDGYYLGASTAVPGINTRMHDYFFNYKNALYIVMADYPPPELIDKIITSNFL